MFPIDIQLKDGRVLFIGVDSAEIYDPGAGKHNRPISERRRIDLVRFFALVILPASTPISDDVAIAAAVETLMKPSYMWQDEPEAEEEKQPWMVRFIQSWPAEVAMRSPGHGARMRAAQERAAAAVAAAEPDETITWDYYGCCTWQYLDEREIEYPRYPTASQSSYVVFPAESLTEDGIVTAVITPEAHWASAQEGYTGPRDEGWPGRALALCHRYSGHHMVLISAHG